jgi:putative effector of murein hydrolase LrgA (UPF0299 family)
MFYILYDLFLLELAYNIVKGSSIQCGFKAFLNSLKMLFLI